LVQYAIQEQRIFVRADRTVAYGEVEGQASVYYYRALDYAKKGDLGPAIADYSKAIELDPKFAPAGDFEHQKCGLPAARGDFGEIDIEGSA
jgi:tetratricopeptide (TPR) repeat protein